MIRAGCVGVPDANENFGRRAHERAGSAGPARIGGKRRAVEKEKGALSATRILRIPTRCVLLVMSWEPIRPPAAKRKRDYRDRCETLGHRARIKRQRRAKKCRPLN
jgi:hypothetical protein